MPTTTTNLNLYKYNSVADGNSTFNIDIALNENWDKIDADSKNKSDSIQELMSHLGEMTKLKTNITITPTGWTQNVTTQLWEYKITDTDITANTMVDVNIQLSYLEKAETLKPVTQSFNRYVLLYASDKPLENIIVDMQLTRQVI